MTAVHPPAVLPPTLLFGLLSFGANPALLLPLHPIKLQCTVPHRTARHGTAQLPAPNRTWSPSTGAPRLFMATRIWWVRPVSGFSRKARSPGRLPGNPAVVKRVTAGSAPPRASSQLPRRPLSMSPTTLPIFLAGRRSESAT